MGVFSPQNGGFGGLWTPKYDYSLSRPQKGTSLRKSGSFKLSTVDDLHSPTLGTWVASIGAVSGNGIIKINLLLHAFPVVTAKERNIISIAFRHRSVHDGHIVEVLQVNGLDGTC